MLILLSFPATVFTFRFPSGGRHTVCFWLMCLYGFTGKMIRLQILLFRDPLPLSGCLNSLHIVPHEIQVHERKMKREEGAMVFKLKLKIANAKLEMKVSDELYDSFTIFLF